MRELSGIGMAALVAVGAAAGCTSNASAGDGGTGTGTSLLLSTLQTETNGAAAEQAYKDHQPSAAEAAQLAAYLSFVIQAKASGAFDLGFLGSNLGAEVRQLGTEYPDFFTVGPDGGLIPKPRIVNSSKDFSCTNNCLPGAMTLSSAFLNALPSGLATAAAAFSSQIGSAAQTLEQSGTPIGQAFDQALANSSSASVQNIIDLFDAAFTQPGDITAAAANLGLTVAETQDLQLAVGAVLVLGLESDVVTALQNADALTLQCQAWQAMNCADGGSGTTGTGGTTGAASTGTGGGAGSSSSSSTGGTTGGSEGAPVVIAQGRIGAIAPGGGFNLSDPTNSQVLAHDSAGNLLTGWLVASDGGCEILEVSFYETSSGTWSTPTELPSPAASKTLVGGSCPGYNTDNGASIYNAALSDNGDAIVVWNAGVAVDDGGVIGGLAIQADHYDHRTSTWEGPKMAFPATGPLNSVDYPLGVQSVALNSSGFGWILSGVQDLGTCYADEVDGIEWVPDSGFQPRVSLQANPCNTIMCGGNPFSAGGYSLAMPLAVPGLGVVALTDGTFVAAWSEIELTEACNNGQLSPTVTNNLEGARGTASSWGTPFALTSPGYNFVDQPPELVSLAAAGTSAMAVWVTAQDAGGPSVLSEMIGTGLVASDTSWESVKPFITGPIVVVSLSNFAGISLGINAGGDGFVSLQLYLDGGAGPDEFVAPVNAFAFGKAQDFSASCALDQSGFEQADWGTVAVDSDGGAAVVWTASGSNRLALAQIYTPAAGWGACQAFGGDGGGFSQVMTPTVADIGEGRWGVVYEFDGNGGSSVDFQTLGP